MGDLNTHRKTERPYEFSTPYLGHIIQTVGVFLSVTTSKIALINRM